MWEWSGFLVWRIFLLTDSSWYSRNCHQQQRINQTDQLINIIYSVLIEVNNINEPANPSSLWSSLPWIKKYRQTYARNQVSNITTYNLALMLQGQFIDFLWKLNKSILFKAWVAQKNHTPYRVILFLWGSLPNMS